MLSLVGDAGVAADLLRTERGPEQKADKGNDNNQGDQATGFHWRRDKGQARQEGRGHSIAGTRIIS